LVASSDWIMVRNRVFVLMYNLDYAQDQRFERLSARLMLPVVE
jgi:hypothetical protein